MIFISGINIIFLSLLFFALVFVFIYLVFLFQNLNISKIEYYLFDSETGTHNFQSDKAIESIISGGFFGKGIGEGTLKNTVPEAHTDYIISVISEEFGVVAIILILFLFLVLIYSVLKKINFESDEKN